MLINHGDRINGANIGTGPASDAIIQFGITNKIDGHQHVARDFTTSENPHVPAIMTTAVAGVLYLPLGIVDHVNQPLFFAVCQNFHGFILRNFTRQTFVDHKLRHFIILDTVFQTMVTIGATQYLG